MSEKIEDTIHRLTVAANAFDRVAAPEIPVLVDAIIPEIMRTAAAALRTQRNEVVEECARVAETWGYHPPPKEQIGTEPPKGVRFWGNTVDNRRGNERSIATAIRNLKSQDEPR